MLDRFGEVPRYMVAGGMCYKVVLRYLLSFPLASPKKINKKADEAEDQHVKN